MTDETIVSTSSDVMRDDQGYEARGIVAVVGFVGEYMSGGINYKIPAYITFDCGGDKPGMCARFIRQAETKKGFLDMSKVQEGDIVVKPGFIYRKCTWTTEIFNAHLAALKRYKRKVIVKHEVDKSAGHVDLGVIDPNNITKQ